MTNRQLRERVAEAIKLRCGELTCKHICDQSAYHEFADVAIAACRVEEMRRAAIAYQTLATCYRLGKRPSEKLFTQLTEAKALLAALDGEGA